jgi:hypothetical protein
VPLTFLDRTGERTMRRSEPEVAHTDGGDGGNMTSCVPSVNASNRRGSVEVGHAYVMSPSCGSYAAV